MGKFFNGNLDQYLEMFRFEDVMRNLWFFSCSWNRYSCIIIGGGVAVRCGEAKLGLFLYDNKMTQDHFGMTDMSKNALLKLRCKPLQTKRQRWNEFKKYQDRSYIY